MAAKVALFQTVIDSGQTRLYSPYPFPWRSETGGLRDAFAQAAWNSFRTQSDQPLYRFEEVDGKPSLRYATADVMRSSCVRCHNSHPDTPKHDWKTGDVRGVLEVVMPLDSTIAQTDADLRQSFLLIAPVGMLGFCTLGLVIHRLRKTSAELKQQVSERTAELRKSNRQLEFQKRALDELAIVAETDTCGRITYVNDKFCEVSQYSRVELIGQNHRLISSGHHPKSFFKDMWDTIRAGRVWHGEIKNRARDSGCYWTESTIIPFLDEEGLPEKYFAIRILINERKQAEAEFAKLNQQLVDSSRQAGMAEVATGVLHNVGNVLNSVNVSANLMAERVRNSRASSLQKACELIKEHSDDLGSFFTINSQGSQLPTYLETLATRLLHERDEMLDEINSLLENVEHIKDIVQMQQTYAKVGGIMEHVSLAALVDDAVKINDAGLLRHGVELVRQYIVNPHVVTDRHKVLQILVNLISNAKYAVTNSGNEEKRVTLHIDALDEDCVKIVVEDSGVGIAKNNLSKIFMHGFTTKKDGHGFGLHSCALAVKELGGSIGVQSEGLGRGATFTLVLPLEGAGAALCEDSDKIDVS